MSATLIVALCRPAGERGALSSWNCSLAGARGVWGQLGPLFAHAAPASINPAGEDDIFQKAFTTKKKENTPEYETRAWPRTKKKKKKNRRPKTDSRPTLKYTAMFGFYPSKRDREPRGLRSFFSLHAGRRQTTSKPGLKIGRYIA